MLRLKAHAKINWFLHISAKRSDGYHEIQSLLQKVSLHDEIIIEPSDAITVETSASIPMEQNLIYRAAVLLRDRFRIDEGARICLDKRIPMGAGLGGGSSDAAATLAGLNSLWGLGLPDEELLGLAAQLGSDVPFFLGAPLSYVSGRGEKLFACRALHPVTLLLVKPGFNLSTEWVYKNFTLLTKKERKVNNMRHFIRNIERAEIDDIACHLSNDLESVTNSSFPVIAGIKEKMKRQGAVFSLMSGSGSTVFGVFESPGIAEDASRDFHGCWTTVAETIV